MTKYKLNNIENNSNTDLRIRRTQKLLIDAIMSLLKEKSFNDIHISDICEKAMVHRTTFYKHFEDKYDLLNHAMNNLLENFEKKILEFNEIKEPRQYYVDLFRIILEHMSKNKEMYVIGLSDSKNDSAIKILQNIVTRYITLRLEQDRLNGITFTIPIQIFAVFYASSVINLSNWWIQEGISISIDDMVKYGDMLISDIGK